MANNEDLIVSAVRVLAVGTDPTLPAMVGGHVLEGEEV
jgi:hypothetical protein